MHGEADVEEVASTYFRADLRPHIDGELALLYWLVSPGREEYIDGGVFSWARVTGDGSSRWSSRFRSSPRDHPRDAW